MLPASLWMTTIPVPRTSTMPRRRTATRAVQLMAPSTRPRTTTGTRAPNTSVIQMRPDPGTGSVETGLDGTRTLEWCCPGRIGTINRLISNRNVPINNFLQLLQFSLGHPFRRIFANRAQQLKRVMSPVPEILQPENLPERGEIHGEFWRKLPQHLQTELSSPTAGGN